MPSAANLSQHDKERLRSLTFFLDYQIGRYLVADALRKEGASVEVHIDHFSQSATDLEWIPEIGRRGWVLITRDANIRRNPLERAAYETLGCEVLSLRERTSAVLNSPSYLCAVLAA